MKLDEPFPLNAVPSRVRHALLREFKGRCPKLREVDQIPDKHWLAAPGMGPTSLEMIRSITNAGRQQTVTPAAVLRLLDSDLLRRLARLQEDLNWLEAHLRAQIATGQKRRPHPHGYDRTLRNETGSLGSRDGETEAPYAQRGRGHTT
jgi:hypothetical protein